MSDAEMADVQMMQEKVRSLTVEHDKWKASALDLRNQLNVEKARREMLADMVDSFIEKLVEK